MKQTLETAAEYQTAAADLDAQLVKGRAPYVAKNYVELTDIPRGERFVKRLAGVTSEDYRHPLTKQYLHWFITTAGEKPEFAQKFKAFWFPVFEYAEQFRPFFPKRRRNMREILEEKAVADFQLSCAVMEGDSFRIGNALYKQRALIEEMMEASSLVQNGNGKVEIFA